MGIELKACFFTSLFNFCYVLVLGKVSSSMMVTFGALLEEILILYPFDFLPVYWSKFRFEYRNLGKAWDTGLIKTT